MIWKYRIFDSYPFNRRFIFLYLLHLNNSICVENFDPITVWIFDESQSLHSAIVWTLDKLNTQLFETIARCVNVWHHDADVAETSWIRISIVVFLIRITFSAPVAITNRT